MGLNLCRVQWILGAILWGQSGKGAKVITCLHLWSKLSLHEDTPLFVHKPSWRGAYKHKSTFALVHKNM